ncbi:SIMPL domain-containing protein [Fontibacter flavus]|uniref:SIMPL domain-containing protein n=1 Tax=Fontibacter flavus TaxID=654838 RepID=A0ABV6FWG9_9BACT
MKKAFLLLPVLFLSLGLMAQDIPLIEVEGSSEISIMPDEALIQISLSEKAMKVADATQALNKKTKSIEDALKKSGVKDFKFYVDNYYVYVNRIYTKGTSKDSGYVASQNIKVLVNDIEKDLAKITETLHQTANMGFNVQLNISDKLRKDSQDKLLEMAIADAKNKAELIAKSLGIEKIQVQKVNYTTQGNMFYPVMRESKMLMASDSAAMMEEPVFRPEERKLTDKVFVSFTFQR